MKKIYFIVCISFLILFVSCNKTKISCEIIKPLSNTTFELGDVVELSVTVDAENVIVSDVEIYLDNVGYASKDAFPYNFQIYTYDLKEGNHTIRAVAIADDGTKSEATVSFNLVRYESPDFVSFSDGQFPLGWKDGNWAVFSPGFDDDYSIRVSAFLAGDLSTVKTCDANINCIEFYAKDEIDNWLETDLSFYIDDNFVRKITLTKSWEKYTIDLPPGIHTFHWRLTHVGEDCSSYLDAIKFFKK
ncbi:MAG: Ig-like domain-containing protein [Lentimicrobiaceae bacterium]|nr:Ig-like domain-containing protein [Lentimicrobiaceae bacterium]